MRRFVVLLGALALLAGCSSGTNHPVQEVTATLGEDRIQHISVTTHSFWFEPNRIIVRSGIPVELTVRNGALFVPHNFACNAEQSGISVSQSVGLFHAKKRTTFTPEQLGEYEFHCRVDGHAQKGMRGTLVVVKP